jgi:mono/diheme cytochrome c family protein
MRSGQCVLIVAALAIGTPAAAQDSGAFGERVVPILNQRCVMCHVEGGALGELSLYPDPWARLVGVASTQSPLKLVEPGSPEKSYLYAKLLGTHDKAGGSGQRMPVQQDPLGAEELETIRHWILKGALND